MRDSVNIELWMGVGAELYGALYVSVAREEHETSLVTRDNIERAVLDALAELMDERGL